MPLGFLVIYVVSLFDKEPSKEMQAYVDEIRKPRGRRCSKKRPDRPRDPIAGGALRGPASFRGSQASPALRTGDGGHDCSRARGA